jgi:nitronate monooxygenase
VTIPKFPIALFVTLYNAYLGNMDKGYAFAGSNAYLATKITSVKEIIDDLVSGFKRAEKEALAYKL